MLTLLREVQIPVLAALLLGACSSKFVRVMQSKSMAAGLGPTALFPLKLRKPAAISMCVTEFGCGIGLIVTAGSFGSGTPANLIRLATGLLFLVATAALMLVGLSINEFAKRSASPGALYVCIGHGLGPSMGLWPVGV